MVQFLHSEAAFDGALTPHPVQILVPPEWFVTLLTTFAMDFP